MPSLLAFFRRATAGGSRREKFAWRLPAISPPFVGAQAPASRMAYFGSQSAWPQWIGRTEIVPTRYERLAARWPAACLRWTQMSCALPCKINRAGKMAKVAAPVSPLPGLPPEAGPGAPRVSIRPPATARHTDIHHSRSEPKAHTSKIIPSSPPLTARAETPSPGCSCIRMVSASTPRRAPAKLAGSRGFHRPNHV